MTGNIRAKYMLTSVLEPLDFQIIQIGLETTVTLICTGATDNGITVLSSSDHGEWSPILCCLFRGACQSRLQQAFALGSPMGFA